MGAYEPILSGVLPDVSCPAHYWTIDWFSTKTMCWAAFEFFVKHSIGKFEDALLDANQCDQLSERIFLVE